MLTQPDGEKGFEKIQTEKSFKAQHCLDLRRFERLLLRVRSKLFITNDKVMTVATFTENGRDCATRRKPADIT